MRLIHAARGAGLKRLVGETLATNENMLGLARRTGFALKYDPQFAYIIRMERHLHEFGTNLSDNDGDYGIVRKVA